MNLREQPPLEREEAPAQQTLVAMTDEELLQLRRNSTTAINNLVAYYLSRAENLRSYESSMDTRMRASVQQTYTVFRAARSGAVTKLQALDEPQLSIALHAQPANWTAPTQTREFLHTHSPHRKKSSTNLLWMLRTIVRCTGDSWKPLTRPTGS